MNPTTVGDGGLVDGAMPGARSRTSPIFILKETLSTQEGIDELLLVFRRTCKEAVY